MYKYIFLNSTDCNNNKNNKIVDMKLNLLVITLFSENILLLYLLRNNSVLKKKSNLTFKLRHNNKLKLTRFKFKFTLI